MIEMTIICNEMQPKILEFPTTKKKKKKKKQRKKNLISNTWRCYIKNT